MKVIVVTEQVECVTFSILHALSSIGVNAWLHVLPGSVTLEANRHYLSLCTELSSGVSSESEFPDNQFDLAIVETGYAPSCTRRLMNRIVRLSRQLTLVTPAFSQGTAQRWKMSLGHVLRYFPFYLRRPGLSAIDDMRPNDIRSLFCRTRKVLGVDVHHKFLTDVNLRERMLNSDWCVDAKRAARIGFVGADSPRKRTVTLDMCELELAKHGIVISDENASCTWIRIGEEGADPIDGEGFCSVLLESDFTLCPCGFAEWSHRPIEALHQGSIPILTRHALICTGLDIVDGKHCIVVENEDWRRAIRRAMELSPENICRMREAIYLLRESGELSDRRTSWRMAQALGVNGSIDSPQ